MLQLGLAASRERDRPSPIRALSYLVGTLAGECAVMAGDKRFEWNTDASVFDAFSRALPMLLEQLRPTGNSLQNHLAELHPVQRELLATPETWAKHCFWSFWDEFLLAAGGTETAAALKEGR